MAKVEKPTGRVIDELVGVCEYCDKLWNSPDFMYNDGCCKQDESFKFLSRDYMKFNLAKVMQELTQNGYVVKISSSATPTASLISWEVIIYKTDSEKCVNHTGYGLPEQALNSAIKKWYNKYEENLPV